MKKGKLDIHKNVSAKKYPFQNPDLPIEKRIDNIISLLTLDEKVACLSTDPSVPRLGIKGTRHVEGLHGLALGGPGRWGREWGKEGPIDKPVPTTTFPQAIGLAESWDVEMIKQVASLEGYEVRYMVQSEKYKRGGLVVRAPNADMGRDPRWGRTEECYGEDPHLTGTMTVAFVKGLQGDHPKYWKTASLMKHFLANSNEDNRGSSSSDFDERLFHEYYSAPFRRGVLEGGSRAYMAAYNAYNGIPCTVHPVLRNITIKKWGQDGIICTDGGAFIMLVRHHHYYTDLNKAAVDCLKAGINQFLDQFYREGVYGALVNKYMTEKEIDNAIRGSFRVMFKLGLLDPDEKVPYSNIGISDTKEPWFTEKHKSFAREVTRKTIVLLKNKNNLLPLNKKEVNSIAVLGPLANKVLLDWYSGTPPYTINPIEGIKNKVGNNVAVRHTDDEGIDAVVKLAKETDVAIVCVGNYPTCNADFGKCPIPSNGKEAVDRRILLLEQEELIKKVYEANPKTIVVLISSFPFAINWSQENVPAILHMTHCSQELGNALADVLFGDYNPAGRLVQTWPKTMEQLPDMMDYNIRNGRTYMYFKGEPLYPFGYGLSYTTFKYSELRVSSETLNKKREITVSVVLQNVGKRVGDEVIQMYVKHLNSKVERPIKELKGFRRITVEPNEKKTVQIPLKAENLAYWNVKKGDFVVEKGKIKIIIGSSSADIKLEKIIGVV